MLSGTQINLQERKKLKSKFFACEKELLNSFVSLLFGTNFLCKFVNKIRVYCLNR